MTFWETIERGEYVMFALAVILIIIILIWRISGARLHKGKKSYPLLMQKLRDHITEGDLENSRQLCASGENPGCRMLEAGLGKVGRPMEEVRTAMKGVSDIEKQRMDMGLGWLRILAVISPLLGFGGTLVGTIDRLRDVAEMGIAADISTLSGAIAPTIVTTVAGLGTGIVALIAYACLNSSATSAKRNLDELGVSFTDLLEEPSA